MNDDRLIIFTTIDVLLCVVGLPAILRQSQTRGRPALYLTRPGNEKGGFEEFKLTHETCHGT